ncbi:bifunctional 3,4-dihydroxy-2-butanone-4-phosphate synthase/GTP cyclohydrolase II [Microlunatus soli]|uniref:Riboflavin biosynthesis protein RibBA n=1 Tax=Microlunatus soli TaxID=630515 RepID=A0A1H1VJ74_9ACTN|nr:bifunctional 3,4-dihydroxy-2-butanone-4-phosphate synthase/GTP cyclohydrolase II [Microlunatus soli]SDS84356.1 3,4-dihydroxy 2-butanone 4-phosphate synthase / GTP cyclohydrolase II [Microlunatus soli]
MITPPKGPELVAATPSAAGQPTSPRGPSTGSGPAADDAAVERVIAEVAAGRPVVVVDDHDREDEGDLIFAGAHSTTELMAFMIRHSSGVVCVPMLGEDLDRLALPAMVADNADPKGTAYAISVDAATEVSTGISAADRSRTVRALTDPGTTTTDLTRPGHVFPLRARPRGVLERRGHTEAAVDLARLAGQPPVGVIAELVNDDGTMTRGRQLTTFAEQHRLTMISIEQLAGYRWRHERLIEPVAVTNLPTAYGIFTAHAYRSLITGAEHVALVGGTVDVDTPVLTRVHSECLTGDAFGSLRCDCGPQLTDALATIAEQGGVLVYLRGQEGRGIGLAPKLQAYQLQESGRDTVDANLDLGLPADARSYDDAAQILRDLGVSAVRLITNNPAKQRGLERGGIDVTELIATGTFAGPDNINYLRTKRDRMGHRLADLDTHQPHHHRGAAS